jgi:hypothetical protein
MILGWRLGRGLYTDVDGRYGKWNYEYALEWGNWFDLSIFNPFSGLGSTFWTNVPWLNPGALVLQLPFSPLATAMLSYLLQFAAYGWTFYCLGRVAGASKLAIACALGLFILLYMPPFPSYWFLMHYSFAPFRLITAAAANLIILSFIIAVKSKNDPLWFAKALAVGLAGLIWGIYASATYFLFDLLIVIAFFVVLLCCVGQFSIVRRLLLLASALVIAFVGSGMVGYLDALMLIPMRPRVQVSDLIKGFDALIFDERVRSAWLDLGRERGLTFWCWGLGSPFSPTCPHEFIGILLLAPVFFCLYAAITRNVIFRAILLCYLLLQVGFWFFSTAQVVVPFFPASDDFGFYLISFSGNTFIVLPYMIVCDRLQRLAARQPMGLSSGMAAGVFSQLSGRLARPALWAMFGVPAATAVFITSSVTRDPNLPPSVLEAIIHGIYKGDVETPIVRHLQKEIALHRADTFRGLAATYLGHNPSIEQTFGKRHRYEPYNPSIFYSIYAQNQHQNSGLWQFGIPTYDEFGHTVTKALYNFTKELFTDRKSPFNYRWIRAYELNPNVMRMLGIRFVLSDAIIDMPDFTEVERFKVTGSHPLQLIVYRLDGVNLGHWSPVEVRVVKDNKALLDLLKRDQTSLRNRVFVSSDPPPLLNELVAMRWGSLTFDRNEFRFQGDSPGWSLALLPLQFSHCWSQTGERPNPDVQLVRANYLLTGLLFKGTVDISYRFHFGPWKSQCRIADAEMVQ